MVAPGVELRALHRVGWRRGKRLGAGTSLKLYKRPAPAPRGRGAQRSFRDGLGRHVAGAEAGREIT